MTAPVRIGKSIREILSTDCTVTNPVIRRVLLHPRQTLLAARISTRARRLLDDQDIRPIDPDKRLHFGKKVREISGDTASAPLDEILRALQNSKGETPARQLDR